MRNTNFILKSSFIEFTENALYRNVSLSEYEIIYIRIWNVGHITQPYWLPYPLNEGVFVKILIVFLPMFVFCVFFVSALLLFFVLLPPAVEGLKPMTGCEFPLIKTLLHSDASDQKFQGTFLIYLNLTCEKWNDSFWMAFDWWMCVCVCSWFILVKLSSILKGKY